MCTHTPPNPTQKPVKKAQKGILFNCNMQNEPLEKSIITFVIIKAKSPILKPNNLLIKSHMVEKKILKPQIVKIELTDILMDFTTAEKKI